MSPNSVGITLKIPEEKIAKDPYLLQNAPEEGTEYFFHTQEKPYGNAEGNEQFTACYSILGNELDTTYMPVAILTCCKKTDLMSKEKKYFLVNGNYLTKDFAEYYAVGEIGDYVVYDFTDFFCDGGFTAQVDNVYSTTPPVHNDSTWLKEFRSYLVESLPQLLTAH